jgi:hypothetical protein
MGYSARYHAASLAGIFLALAIGILIGVGLGDNVVSGTTKGLEQSLKSDLADTRSRADALQGQLNQERDLSDQIYPALVDNLLRGDRIAVVALGGFPDNMKGDIESVAGAGSPTGAQLGEFVVVREPPDLQGLADAAAKGTPARGVARNPDGLSGVARRVGRSLVEGGPPLNRFRDPLLVRGSGRAGGIDAVIVVRERPGDLGSRQSAATDHLEAGLLDGMESAGGVPVVGVERSDSDGSAIGFYDSQGLSATVDSIDLTSGRVALAYALHGDEGDYGIKSTADRLLPELRRPPAASATGPGLP